MHLTKCDMGHIYDAEKFRSCPHCYKGLMTDEDEMDVLGMHQANEPTQENEDEIRKQFFILNRRKTVGVLVCVSGAMKGEAFLLKEGENLVGRGESMDVALTMEESVSRREHGIIVCDDNTGTYELRIDPQRDDVYVNGTRAKDKMHLRDRDVISFGQCELVIADVGDIWKKRRK